MKLSKSKLMQLVREEFSTMLSEVDPSTSAVVSAVDTVVDTDLGGAPKGDDCCPCPKPKPKLKLKKKRRRRRKPKYKTKLGTGSPPQKPKTIQVPEIPTLDPRYFEGKTSTKLSKSKLKQIIREELRKTLHEEISPDDAELAKYAEISGRTDHRVEALEKMVHKLYSRVRAIEIDVGRIDRDPGGYHNDDGHGM